MNGINRVFLLGYLGSPPEEVKSKSGKAYVRLSLATHFNRKLESGERESSTTWHRITVWGKNAERCRSRLGVGSPLAVEGYLSRYSYEKSDGTDASGYSIVAREVHFVGGAKGARSSSSGGDEFMILEDDAGDGPSAGGARSAETVQAHS